jgi:hypothetical protein
MTQRLHPVPLLFLLSAAACATDWQAPVRLDFHASVTSDGQTTARDISCVGISQFHLLPDQMHMPPWGFGETVTDETITVAGTAHACRKHLWTRGAAPGFPSLRCMTITAWTDDHVATPAFAIPLARGQSLPVPAGCIRYAATPLHAGDPKAFSFDVEAPTSADLEWQAADHLVLGTHTIATQRYSLDSCADSRAAQGTLVVSPDIDGQVVSEDVQVTGHQNGHVITALVAIADEPAPPGLVGYDNGSFAFVPPAPMTPIAPEPGQFCRFGYGDAWLAVAPFDPQGMDIETWFKPRMEDLMKQQKPDGSGMKYTVFGCFYSFTNIACADGSWIDETTGIQHCFFIHQGKGYDVSFNHAPDMNIPQVAKLMEGWRWPVEKTSP